MNELERFQQEWQVAAKLLLSDKLLGDVYEPEQKMSVIALVIKDLNHEHARLNAINWPQHISEEYQTEDVESTLAFRDASLILGGVNTWTYLAECNRRLHLLILWQAMAVNNERYELASQIRTAYQTEWTLFRAFAKLKGTMDEGLERLLAQASTYLMGLLIYLTDPEA